MEWSLGKWVPGPNLFFAVCCNCLFNSRTRVHLKQYRISDRVLWRLSQFNKNRDVVNELNKLWITDTMPNTITLLMYCRAGMYPAVNSCTIYTICSLFSVLFHDNWVLGYIYIITVFDVISAVLIYFISYNDVIYSFWVLPLWTILLTLTNKFK